MLIKKHWRPILLLGIILGSFLLMLTGQPIKQDQNYHKFIDQRTFLGIPNFFDVISNVAFLLIGILGLNLFRNHALEGAFWSWAVFFLGVGLVSFGSGYYHWSPCDKTLEWDRLPMTIGFMGLLIGILSEHIDLKVEKFLLIPAVLLGLSSVLYWIYFDDLKFYFWIQYIPLLTIPVVLIIFNGGFNKRWFLVIALLFYLLAKVSEKYDERVFLLSGKCFSGHSLKHILAEISCFVIYQMLKRRVSLQQKD
ncbi:MAG: ceramidase domain-containing protein [Candidatus Riflebacteria bacterium]|nr:ceramidase domain-containing protein [Candidatus Riflebacteria bacterium]